MSQSLQLPRFSIGVGDRFAHQAVAQMTACQLAQAQGVEVVPVWNKSNREHKLIGSDPAETRRAANAAVTACDWRGPFFVDADHINRQTVDPFLDSCDFFTLDVADLIGKPVPEAHVDAFLGRHPELIGNVLIPSIVEPIQTTEAFVREAVNTFLAAIKEAGVIYRYIADRKGTDFVVEISMDETAHPQTPAELMVILAAIAEEQIPIQTIAPKFSGHFNKGVDYVGDLERFAREFDEDLAAVAFAVANYGLPTNLKLSIHSGSDKFSLYPILHEALARTGAGIHLKTAGTTWLEEVIGLAEAGSDGLALAKEIYDEAFAHAAELTAPYASVIDIDVAELPRPRLVHAWSSDQFTRALRHNATDASFNGSFRQLLHVAFKIAATFGDRYLHALEKHHAIIARNVTTNLLERHILAIFPGKNRLERNP